MSAQINRANLPTDETGRPMPFQWVRSVDALGNDSSGIAYQMLGTPGTFGGTGATSVGGTAAVGDTLAANTGTAFVTVQRGAFVWDAQFTGTSLVLQILAADGVTPRNVSTLSASGTQTGLINIGIGSRVRIYNPNGTAVTNAFSSIS